MKTRFMKCIGQSLILSMLALTAFSCSDDDAPSAENVDNTRKDIVLSRSEQAVADQSMDFAFRLLQVADTDWDKEQLVLSPFSASVALSMAANGAAGDTRLEILNTLGFSGLTIDEVNDCYQKLVNELVVLDRTTTLSVANSAWMNKGFEALDAYKEAISSYYDAELRTADFGASSTLDKINAWCSEKTNGCIPEFLKKLSASTRLILLNAIYFKGKWTEPFKEKDTQQGVFYGAKGNEQVQYMHQTNTYPYTKCENFAVAAMPYGNEAFNMLVLLPDEGVNLSDCLSDLNAEKWNSIVSGMKTSRLAVKLPKFKVEDNASLLSLLEKMGIVKAFSGNADFSNLSKEDLFISEVQQANYFCVNEEGVEAAAVTDVEFDLMDPGAGEVAGPTEFYVTRPFLFVLQEKSTGTILFLGKISGIG